MAYFDEFEDYGEDQDPQYPWTFAQYPDLMAARQKEEDPNDELLRWMHENQLKKKEEDDRRAQSDSDHSPWESFGSMFTVPNAIRTIGSTGGGIAGGAAGAFFGGAGAVPGAMIGSAIGGGGADALARWYAGEEQNPWASGVEAASAGLTAPLGLGLPGKAAGAKAIWNFMKSQAGVGMLDAAVGANPRKMAEEGIWNKEGQINLMSPWELAGQTAVGGLTGGALAGVTGGAHTRYADWKGSPFDVQPPPGFKRGGGLPLEEGMPGREPIFPKLPKETQPGNPATTGAGLIPPTRSVGVQDLPGAADDFSLAANVGNVAPNAVQHPWVIEALKDANNPADYAENIEFEMRMANSNVTPQQVQDFLQAHPFPGQAQTAQPTPAPFQGGPPVAPPSDAQVGQQIGQQALESDITPPVNLPGDVDIDAAIGRGDQAATAADNAARGRFSPQTQSARLEFEELIREIREARDLKDSLRADPIKANDAFLSRIPPTDPGTLAFLAQQGTITPQEASAIQQYQRAGREQQTRPGFNFATQNQPQGPGNLTGGYDLTTNQGIIDARQELMDGLQDGSIGAQEFKTRLDEVNAAHDRILQGDVTPGQAPPVAPPAEPEAGAVEAPPVFDVKGMAGKVEAPIPIQKEEPQSSTLGQVAEGASRKIGMGATRIEGVFRAMEEELSTIADPVQRGKAKLDYIADNLSDGDIYQARLMGLISPQQDAILSQRTRNAFTDAEITGEAPDVFFPAEKASEDERAGFDSRLQAERAAGRQDWKYYSQRQIGDNPVTPKEIAQEREDIQEQFGSGDMPQAEYDERRAELDRLEADPTRMAKDPATTGPPVSDPTRPAATRPEIVIRRLSQEDLDLSNRLLSQLTETMGEANPQTDEEINGFLRRAFSNDELSDAVRLQIIDQAQADAVGKMTDPNEGPKFARDPVTGKAHMSVNVANSAKELTSGYSKPLPHVMAREGMQNALDAVKDLGAAGDIQVNVLQTGTNLDGTDAPGGIEIIDNGKGMSPDELYTVYTNLHESGKTNDPNATGGKGVGKATYMLGGSHFEVETVKQMPDGTLLKSSFSGTPDELMAGFDIKEEVVPKGTPTGTRFKTTFRDGQYPHHAEDSIDSVMNHSRNREATITVNKGQWYPEEKKTLTGGANDEKAATDVDLGHGNSKMDVYIPEGVDIGERGSVYVRVLNNGMWQFDQRMFLKDGSQHGIPEYIVADIKPQVPELSNDYPFPVQRETLKDNIWEDLEKGIEANVIAPKAAGKKKDLVQIWTEMVTTPVGAEGNARENAFFDSGGRLRPNELRQVTSSPTIIQSQRVIDQFLNDVLNNRNVPDETKRLIRTGIMMGDPGVYGMHIPNPGAASGANESAILVDLWAHILKNANDPEAASRLFRDTILHEAAHIGWRSPGHAGLKLSAKDLQDPRLGEYLQGYMNEVNEQGGLDMAHGMSFVQRLGEIYGTTGVETAFDHTNDLTRILRGGHGSGGYGSEIPKLLQLYKDSRRRPAVTEDILSPTGVKSKDTGPDGAGPIPGDNPATGNGATPNRILGPDGRPIGIGGGTGPIPGGTPGPVPPIVGNAFPAPGNVPPPVAAGGGGSIPPGGMPPTGGGGGVPPNVPPPNPAGGFGNMPYGPAGQGRFGTAVNPIGFKTRLHAALVKAPTDAAFKWWVNHREAAQSFGALLGNKFKKFDNVSFTQYQQNPQAYPEVHNYFANWHRDLTNAGVKMGQKDNYLPQLWENPQAVAQLPQTQQNRLLLKPGFTFNAMVQNYEEGIKQGLVPKFKTISELGNFYETAARKAMADRQFFEYLKQNKLLKPRGAKGTGGWQSLNLDFFPTATLGKKPTTWVISPQFSAGKTLVKGRPRMGKEAIENYLTKDNPIYDKIANVASNLKNLRLVGGVPFTGLNAHGKNTFVRWLGSSDKRVSDFATGAGYLINPRSARRKLASYGAALPDARAHGLTVTGEEFDADKFLRPGSPKGVLERTNHALDKVFADPLFRNIIPAMKMQRYEALASQYVTPGMNPQQMAAAKNKAAQEVNALFGGINWKELGESQHTQNLLRTFALAPDWMRTNVQGGKRMYNAILDPNSKESKMYLRLGANLLAGVVAATTLNKTMTGKWSHENDAGHEFDVVVGKDSKGKNIYVQPFGTAADFARLPLQAVKALFIDKDPGQVPQMMRNRASIPVGQGLDWYGGDFRGEKMLSDRYGKKKDYSEILKGLVDDASDLLPNPVEAPIDWMRGSTSGAEAVSRMFEAPLGFAMPKDGGGRGRKRIQRKSIR